jgi:ArsR family transcriptional regulator
MPKRLAAGTLEAAAAHFKVLSEPARLRVIDTLRRGPLHVGAIIDATGLSQANLSKHLQLLHASGFVRRRREGLFVHYSIADPSVFRLCDLVCGQIERHARQQVTRLRAVR